MQAAAATRPSVVHPTHLSHGTLACRDIAKSRRFYEEFLGLEVVRHAKPAMMLRLATNMYVVCVCIGEKVPQNHLMTHWGINVAAREDVDRARAEAVRLQDEFEIRVIKNVRDFHGAYGFYLQDRDYNWWEIQHEPRKIDDFFAKGDQFGRDLQAVDTDVTTD
jgi:catechol 2,3-dioxygenase-like lactoylglutathione lyase family enzyme